MLSINQLGATLSPWPFGQNECISFSVGYLWNENHRSISKEVSNCLISCKCTVQNLHGYQLFFSLWTLQQIFLFLFVLQATLVPATQNVEKIVLWQTKTYWFKDKSRPKSGMWYTLDPNYLGTYFLGSEWRQTPTWVGWHGSRENELLYWLIWPRWGKRKKQTEMRSLLNSFLSHFTWILHTFWNDLETVHLLYDNSGY